MARSGGTKNVFFSKREHCELHDHAKEEYERNILMLLPSYACHSRHACTLSWLWMRMVELRGRNRRFIA